MPRPCLARLWRWQASLTLAAILLAPAFSRPLLAADSTSPTAGEQSSQAGEVQIVRDVAYRGLYPGEDAREQKNKLDLYLPRGVKDYPVLFFVHGGAW